MKYDFTGLIKNKTFHLWILRLVAKNILWHYVTTYQITLILFLDDSFLVINLSDYAYVSRSFLTLSCIMFKNGQIYFKNLAHTAKFLKYGWRFFSIIHESVIIFGHRFF